MCFQDISDVLFEISATVPLQMCSFELWSLCIQHTLLCDLCTIDLIALTRKKLLHTSALCPILMKYKTRRSLAVALVNELVDTEMPQVHYKGKRKDQLDPSIC